MDNDEWRDWVIPVILILLVVIQIALLVWQIVLNYES